MRMRFNYVLIATIMTIASPSLATAQQSRAGAEWQFRGNGVSCEFVSSIEGSEVFRQATLIYDVGAFGPKFAFGDVDTLRPIPVKNSRIAPTLDLTDYSVSRLRVDYEVAGERNEDLTYFIAKDPQEQTRLSSATGSGVKVVVGLDNEDLLQVNEGRPVKFSFGKQEEIEVQTSTIPANSAALNACLNGQLAALGIDPADYWRRFVGFADLRVLFSTGDYPRQALLAEEQGSVRALLTINAKGRVDGCTILEQSGSASIDQATCTILKSRSRFPKSDHPENGDRLLVTEAIKWQIPRL